MIRILCDGRKHSFPALPVTIGRDADNDLPLDDSKLSRRHCRICRTPEGIAVEDMDSSNGTFVNGERAAHHLLRARDTIRIGVSSLSVEWDPEAVPPPRRKKRSAAKVSELEAENLRLRRILTLTHAVASEHQEERLLRRILDSSIEITGAERGFLFLVTLHGLDFRAALDSHGKDIKRPEEHISRSIAREAIESVKPVMTEDAGGDARFAGGRSVAFLRLRSVLCVPLKVPDGPIGAIYLENSGVTARFHDRDIPFVTAFGDFAALTLASARSLGAIQRREEQLRQSRERIGRLNARLKALLRRQSRELAGVRADLDFSRQELGLRYDSNAIVGQSPAMRAALALVDRLIDTEQAVWIHGASGTGKELIARAIHYNGPRAKGHFVTVSCGAIPPELLEAELFGVEGRPGFLERADRGTLFLDNVEKMPLPVQERLADALGRDAEADAAGVNVRLLTASRSDPGDLLGAGRVHPGLHARLTGAICRLPSLEERAEDIPALVDHFLDLFCAEQEIDRPAMEPEVIDRLQAYPWPGNIRELRNEVQRLLTLQRGRITPDLLSLPVYSGDPEAVPPVDLPAGGLKALVENLERRVLLDTMRRLNGNKTRAAAVLGLSRLGLRKKLERYGMS